MESPTSPQVSTKEKAGREAAKRIKDGMCLGLGTGSTVAFFLEALAERIQSEGLSIVGVATSEDTEARAKSLGISTSTLEETPVLDLVVDGADEVDGKFRLIKGGGGALLRFSSQLLCIFSDCSLGAHPMERLRFVRACLMKRTRVTALSAAAHLSKAAYDGPQRGFSAPWTDLDQIRLRNYHLHLPC